MTSTDGDLVADVRLGLQTLVETATDVAVLFQLGDDDDDDEVFGPTVPAQSTWGDLPLVGWLLCCSLLGTGLLIQCVIYKTLQRAQSTELLPM